MGPSKLRWVAAPMAATSPARRRPRISSRVRMASWRPCHSASERSRYFSVTISRMGPTSCAMPPCTRTRLDWRLWRVAAETSSVPRMRWRGSRQPRLMPNSESPAAAVTPSLSFMPGHSPPEAFQPPQNPPSHSPRMARAAARRRSVSVNWPVSEWACPVARIETEINEASRLVETARREPLGISFTRLTISRPCPCRPGWKGRHDAGSDHRGLQQAQIVAREIEDLGQRGDFGGGSQIDAGEAQHRLVDHAQPGFHGRLGRAGAAYGEVDRNIQHARAFWKIHAQEKDVAPAAVGQVHAYRCGLAQDGEEAAGMVEKFGADAQRIIGGVAGAEHPLIAAHVAHAAAHLSG